MFLDGAGHIESHANLLHRMFWPIQIAAGVTVMRNGSFDASCTPSGMSARPDWIEQGFSPKRIQTLYWGIPVW